MRVSKLFAAVAAASLVATPVLAQSTASKLSVAGSSALQDETIDDGTGAGAGGWVIAAGAAAAVILGIVVIADGDDDESDSN